MKRNARTTISWIIIAMMAVLPLRVAMASAEPGCGMHEQASPAVHDHAMHAEHVMDAAVNHEHPASADCCCCDGDMGCFGDCGPGSGVSVIVSPAISVPVLQGSAIITHVNKNPVFRELAPPIRPPAIFQI